MPLDCYLLAFSSFPPPTGALTYRFSGQSQGQGLGEVLGSAEKYLVSEEYKRRTLARFSADELITVAITQPTVVLARSEINTPVKTLHTSFAPLGNLVFTRDQQIVTSKGVILGVAGVGMSVCFSVCYRGLSGFVFFVQLCVR